MTTVTYDDYPLLNFPESVVGSENGTLPFKIPYAESKIQTLGITKLMLNIIEKYSKGNSPERYYVSPETLHAINTDSKFSEFHFNKYTKSAIPTEIGHILLPNKSMFLYLSLSSADTLIQHYSEGNYFGVAYFKEDILEGYEEVIINEMALQKGNSLYKTPSYEGRLLAFAIKCLSIAKDSRKLLTGQRVIEPIYSF